MYVPLHTIVHNDAIATAGEVLSHELLFRTGIVSHLASAVVLLMLSVVLYKLFKDVHAHQARLLVLLMVVQVPIVFILESFKLTTLITLKGQVLKDISLQQMQSLAMLFLKIHGSGIVLLELFWGLWLIPFAVLIYNSRFAPRLLAWLLLFAGLGYAVDSATTILFPHYHSFTQKIAFLFSGLGELSVIGWLLRKGIKSQPVLSA